MISTLIFGTFMKPVQKCLVPPTKESKNEYANTAEEKEKREILEEHGQRKSFLSNSVERSRKTINEENSSSSDEHEEEILHPN